MMHSLLLHPNSQSIYDYLLVDRPQGLLVSGPSDFGTSKILDNLAAQYVGNKSTNIIRLAPLEDSKVISIEQVRELKTKLRLKSSDMRVVLINQAGNMTIEAQNSLLKQLEEPVDNICFIFSVNSLYDVLPTIKSRVYVWQLLPPTNDQLFDHLKDYDPVEVKKAVLMGQGRVELVKAILDNSPENKALANIQYAKDLILKKPFDRLLIVDSISKDKLKTSEVLDGLEIVCKSAIEHIASLNNRQQLSQWLDRLENVLIAKNNIKLNVQTKLQLTNLLLVL